LFKNESLNKVENGKLKMENENHSFGG